MKKFLLLIALLGALVAAPQARLESVSNRQIAGRDYARAEILVKLKDEARFSGAGEAVLDRLLPAGKREVEPLSAGPASAPEDEGLYVVRLSEGVSVEEAIAQAVADPQVEYAEPNYYARLQMVPNDTNFAAQWALYNTGANDVGRAGADIGAVQAWEMTTGGEGIVVAVIDSGYDLAHPDLAANTWVNPREVVGNSLDDDGNGFVDDINGWNFFSGNNAVNEDPSLGFEFGHGTHVSGIIGAVGNNGRGTTGVAWQVELMPLRVFGRNSDDEVVAKVSDIVKAINYAVEQRRRGVNVRVINASLGDAPSSTSFREAIEKAGRQGILFVTSAGNSDDDNDVNPGYPGAWGGEIETLISVAALDRSDRLTSYTSYGHRTIDVAAPGGEVFGGSGERIYSTLPGGIYGYFAGTSQATPHVSGVAVLLWSREPGLTPAQVKQRIRATADPVLSASSLIASSGRVNAHNALTNTIPAAGAPGLARVSVSKKFVTVDGLNFASGSTVVEVNGVAVAGKVKYPSDYRLANGRFTRAEVKAGKSAINTLFPRGSRVTVTVYNPATGERSEPVNYTRPLF